MASTTRMCKQHDVVSSGPVNNKTSYVGNAHYTTITESGVCTLTLKLEGKIAATASNSVKPAIGAINHREYEAGIVISLLDAVCNHCLKNYQLWGMSNRTLLECFVLLLHTYNNTRGFTSRAMRYRKSFPSDKLTKEKLRAVILELNEKVYNECKTKS